MYLCNNWGWKLAFWAGVPRQLGVSVDVFSCANYAIKVNFVERNASQCIYFQRKQTAIRLTLRKHVQFCRCCYVSITFLVCAVIFIFCLVNSVYMFQDIKKTLTFSLSLFSVATDPLITSYNKRFTPPQICVMENSINSLACESNFNPPWNVSTQSAVTVPLTPQK